MTSAVALQTLTACLGDDDTTEASEPDLLSGNMLYKYGAVPKSRLPLLSLDDHSVHSYKSSRSHKRRCEHYQDGYDDDDDIGAAKASARAERRASLKSNRRSSIGSSKRKTSLSGGSDDEVRPRRSSLNMSAIHSIAMPRRASLSNDMALPRRVSMSSGMRTIDLTSARSARRASLSGGFMTEDFNPDEVKYSKPKAGRRASFTGDPFNIDPYAGHPQSPETVKSVLPMMSAEEIIAALSPVAKKGINPDALARMSRRMSGQYVQEDEDSRQDSFQNLGYGYGYAPPQILQQAAYSRRPSASSRASSTSRKSRRLSNRMPKEIASIPIDIESDLDNSDSESDDHRYRGSNRLDKYSGYGSTSKSNLDYGYGDGGKNGDIGYAYNGGYESDTRSRASSCSRASRRRNSCIIRPDQMSAVVKTELYESDADSSSARDDDVSTASNRVSRRNSCCIVESDDDENAKVENDLDDPDSLLSRSGFYNKESKIRKPSQAKEPLRNSFGLARSNDVYEQTHEEDEDQELLFENSKPVEKTSLEVISSFRQKPFTTVAPPKQPAMESNAFKNSVHRSWAELEFDSESDSSSVEESESERSFGSSLYEDDIHQEVDCYHQRARRRTSLEAGCIDMRELLKFPKKHPEFKQIPNFTPAEGCKNASDFIVRCFAARLRHGITVLKHNRNRWTKSQYRVLYLLPDGKSLTWKPLAGEKDKGKRPILDLTKCTEVRHASTKDPANRRLTGTHVLRKHAKENTTSKSLSLIFQKRTLDMSALSTDLCKVLLEGFSALCFRLQLDKQERGSGEFFDCCSSVDDDFASTIYGGGSTVSMSITNGTCSAPHSFWGL